MKLQIERMDDGKDAVKVPDLGGKWNHSPVGWWKVTTEGDQEGKSIKNLGWHYGHVVEIALSLDVAPCYAYCFSPPPNDAPDGMFSAPTEYPAFVQVRKKVAISLPIESGTWDIKGEARDAWFKAWLDSEDVEIVPNPAYSSVTVKLKESD